MMKTVQIPVKTQRICVIIKLMNNHFWTKFK